MMEKMAGPIFAILTPFQANGKIDFTALNDYLSFLQEKGVEIILANGTTAEFPSLLLEERKQLIEYCRQEFKGIILNNVSSCCLHDSFDLIAHAKDYADALVVLPPYYYANASEQGILSFLAEVLNQSPLPVYLYHFPKHTQNPITPKMVEMLLSNHDNLVGLKDSEANLETSLKFKALKGGNFQVFVGSDKLALEILKSGLDGYVTGGGNPFPELLMSIFHSFQTDDLNSAEKTQSILDLWLNFREQKPLSEIALTKVALRTRLESFPSFVRYPLLPSEGILSEQIASFINTKMISLL